MNSSKSITELLYGFNVTAFQWNFFSRNGTLVFSDSKSTVHIDLRGIHYLSFRQSLLGPESCEWWQDCAVDLIKLNDSSELLMQYMNKEIRFASEIAVYDAQGTPQGTNAFCTPKHLLLVCSAGDLDVIVEEALVIK